MNTLLGGFWGTFITFYFQAFASTLFEELSIPRRRLGHWAVGFRAACHSHVASDLLVLKALTLALAFAAKYSERAIWIASIGLLCTHELGSDIIFWRKRPLSPWLESAARTLSQKAVAWEKKTRFIQNQRVDNLTPLGSWRFCQRSLDSSSHNLSLFAPAWGAQLSPLVRAWRTQPFNPAWVLNVKLPDASKTYFWRSPNGSRQTLSAIFEANQTSRDILSNFFFFNDGVDELAPFLRSCSEQIDIEQALLDPNQNASTLLPDRKRARL